MNVTFESRLNLDGMSSRIDRPFKTKEEAKKSVNDYYEHAPVGDKTTVFVLEIKKKLVYKREPMGGN